MKSNLYLLSFTVSGVKNIEKKIKLDFYKKTVDRSFEPEKYRVKAIYGENGSGKTAIITAIQIMKDLVTSKRYLADSQNQQFLKEIINKKTNSIFLETEFIVGEEDHIVFKYAIELKLFMEEIIIVEEKLQEKNANYSPSKYKEIFSVENGEIIYLLMQEKNVEYFKTKTMNLLSLQTFVASLFFLVEAEFGKANEDIKEKYGEATFIRSITLFVCFLSISTYLDESDQHKLYTLKKYLGEIDREQNLDVSFWERLDDNLSNTISSKQIEIKEFDRYERRIKKLSRFIQIFKPQLVQIDIDKKEDGKFYICNLLMNYGEYRVNREFESTGINKLIRLFDCFTSASQGNIVFIDELDSNINDIYLCKLLEYFMDFGKGQLCFTTHNLDPMNELKRNKNSINFLSNVNTIYSWTSSGNASPEKYYKNGMIEDSPFNIDATDFIGILGDNE